MNEEITITIVDAIDELRPGAEWVIDGGTYSGLRWLDKSQTKPSETEVSDKLSQIKLELPAKLVREKRNQLLSESDWTQTRDNVRLNDSSWIIYRQELRDITKSASFNPKLNADGTLDQSSVTWPLKPST